MKWSPPLKWLSGITIIVFCFIFSTNIPTRTKSFEPAVSEIESPALINASKLALARQYVIKNGYNAEECFLADMSVPSGAPRFYVYNFTKEKIVASGLVTHGHCNTFGILPIRYTNTPNSNCTSLGKYKIGKKYYGRFGLAYKLHGLDSTNSNAFKRYIVLHSHECVPDEASTDEICQSEGCPTVSINFLKKLSVIIDNSSKPVLLWMYR